MHLQKLFLYDNSIQQITNLEMLVNLHVLWLNKNQIADIQVAYVYEILRYCKLNFKVCYICIYAFVLQLILQGLNSLVNLKELNLADNAVETLGRSTVKHHIFAILAFDFCTIIHRHLLPDTLIFNMFISKVIVWITISISKI